VTVSLRQLVVEAVMVLGGFYDPRLGERPLVSWNAVVVLSYLVVSVSGMIHLASPLD
jgi:hypothetical protein